MAGKILPVSLCVLLILALAHAHAGETTAYDELSATGAFNRNGNRPYVVTASNGRLYARCVPAKDEGTEGTTKIYLVGKDKDELVASFGWYASKQGHCGIWFAWNAEAGKIALMRIHDEAEPLTDGRVEFSFYLGEKLLQSFTARHLIALGCEPKDRVDTLGRRAILGYAVAGYGFSAGEKPSWAIVIGKRVVRFDPLTGDMRDEVKHLKRQD